MWAFLGLVMGLIAEGEKIGSKNLQAMQELQTKCEEMGVTELCDMFRF